MQPADFNDLQALWQTSEPGDSQRVETMSRRVVLRQRAIEVAEVVLGAVLLAIVVFAVLQVDAAPAAGLGLAIALLIAYSIWSRFRLRRIEELVDVRGQHAYLVQLLISRKARLRRLVLGLASFLPGLLLGNLFASATGISDEQMQEFLLTTVPGGPLVSVGLLLISIILPIVLLVRAILRQRSEIKQLEIVLAGFEEQLDHDAFGA